MDVQRNHLIDGEEFERLKKEGLAGAYQRVPGFLENAANKKLNGNKEAKVSFRSGGKLSEWAKRVRKNNNINDQENG